MSLGQINALTLEAILDYKESLQVMDLLEDARMKDYEIEQKKQQQVNKNGR